MEDRLRLALWGVAAMTAVGIPLELALAGHWESPPQLIPFALSGLALIACAAAVVRPSRTTVLSARYAMVAVGLGGLFGIWEHLEHNASFAMEIDSSLGGLALVVEAITGANPLLAPGAFLVVALAGASATWGHPALAD